jgi:P27 family predicted phage terminase small subunit
MGNKNTLLQQMKAAASEAKKDAEEVIAKDSKFLKPIVALDDEGEVIFKMVLDYLDNKGILETADAITITMLAKNISMFVMVSREIQTVDDIVQYYENGSSNVSGKMTALSKVQAEVARLSAKLGLSPMDRARMMGASTNAAAANSKGTDGDEIDKLVG